MIFSPDTLPARPVEQRALDTARRLPGERILCTTAGRAQAAGALAIERPAAKVTCWYLDLHLAQLAERETTAPNLTHLCQADPPAEEIDLAIFPLSMSGDAEWTRDLLQRAYDRLAIGGRIVAVTNNSRDLWLRTQLATLTKRIAAERTKEAMCYVATKHAPLKKLKDYRCEFAFRDTNNLVRAVSRPGVFSHRHLDPGARQLLGAAQLSPGMKMLDIGCGAGTVGLALARREATCQVTMIDSNARAVECARAGAELNELTNVTVVHNAAGECGGAGSFDLAVANPPYFSDYEIAARFVTGAHRNLRPGGKLLLVTKNPQWYADHLPRTWSNVEIAPAKQYFIAAATKKR